MLAWYRALIALRRSTPDLREPDLRNVRVDFDEAAGWLRMTRGAMTLALNLAAGVQTVAVPAGASLRLASGPGVTLDGSAMRLPADSIAIVTAGPGN
jgi:maltooligosyltrehalose trehalohydrolase